MNDTVYTWEEVAKHKSKQDGVWVVVHNEVYDVTKFLDDVSSIKLIDSGWTAYLFSFWYVLLCFAAPRRRRSDFRAGW